VRALAVFAVGVIAAMIGLGFDFIAGFIVGYVFAEVFWDSRRGVSREEDV
jgi:membrane protein DedA with SNARE-associated domain